MVVVVEPLLDEYLGLLLREDAQRGVHFHVGLVADEPDGPEGLLPLVRSLLLGDALLRDHDAEPLGPVGLGPLGRVQDLLRFEEAVGVDTGVEVGGLCTEATVLRAVARLRVHDGTGVDRPVRELTADHVRGGREFVDGLGDECQSIPAAELLARQHALGGVVYRPVACLVNHAVAVG